MKKFLSIVFAASMFYMGMGAAAAFAGETDALLQKLVDKNILTSAEAQQIRTETNEEVAKIDKQKADEQKELMKKSEPNIKLKGDLRTRYQWEKRKGNANQEDRVRLRLRVGADGKVNDKVKAHFQLATGSRNDLRSTNQTLGGNANEAFGHYDFWIDQMYVDYAPADWAKIYGGKMPLSSVFWQTGDMLFDSDINPDGASVVFNKELTGGIEGFVNAGWWILQDRALQSKVSLSYIQPGIKTKIMDNASLKLAGGYLYYNSLKGKDVDVVISSKSSDTNSTVDSGLAYDFNSFIFSSELGVDKPVSFLPYASIFGDYVNNLDAPSNNTGYLLGLKFGDKKIKDWGQWQAKYVYRHIGQDAVLDIFPDSDALGGKTDVEVNEFIFEYGIGKNVTFGLDYYLSERIKATANNHSREHLIQTDIVYKF